MASNIANRNISLILLIACMAGLIYCIIHTVQNGESWIRLSSIVLPTAIFLKMYLRYRKAVKEGNIYGKINPWK